VDSVPEHLDKAGEVGAVPVDYRRADPVRQIRELRRSAGRARPGRIVSHHGGLDEAPRFYDDFDRRTNGVIKAVLRP
jgi:hypothetical protein